jgi:hypothetical protein
LLDGECVRQAIIDCAVMPVVVVIALFPENARRTGVPNWPMAAVHSPSLVKAAVDGRLQRGIGVARLFDAPVAWSRQHQMLGFGH